MHSSIFYAACVVCVSVFGHTDVLCKRGWNNRDAVWRPTHIGPRGSCTRWGSGSDESIRSREGWRVGDATFAELLWTLVVIIIIIIIITSIIITSRHAALRRYCLYPPARPSVLVSNALGVTSQLYMMRAHLQAVVDFKTPGEGRRCGRASRADSAICLMHNNLSSGIVYYFGVVAYNSSGSSEMSDIVHCHTLSESQSTLPSMLSYVCYVVMSTAS